MENNACALISCHAVQKKALNMKQGVKNTVSMHSSETSYFVCETRVSLC